MILSRTVAKARIARGDRPGWLAAWGLVLVDFLLVAAYCVGAIFLLYYWAWAYSFGMLEIVALGFLLVFVPLQAVLIISALWATKSRWQDTPEDPK